MSTYTEARRRSFLSSAALGAHLRVKFSTGKMALAGSTDVELGTVEEAVFAANKPVSVNLRTAQGTTKFVASEAVTAGNDVYAAANGKVAASGTILIGKAFSGASGNNSIIEVLRIGEASNSAANGGTTAAAFLVDSDSTTPKIELASQPGGTGNFKTTLKPESTLSADNAIIVPEADGDVLAALALAQTFTNKTLSDGTKDTRAAQTVNPAADNAAGSQILTGVTQVNVGAVATNANDWINLPPIAGVGIGHEIVIACNAGSNFELRTPASSNTKINDVDSDGTQEYLCTDTDMIIVRKHTTTGWIAQSLTKLGAVRTAVVPDA